MADWISKWQRSDRQDRRVVIDGVFYEQAPAHIAEKQRELEVVREANEHGGNWESHAAEVEMQKEATDGQAARVDAGTSAGSDVPIDGHDSGDSETDQSTGREASVLVRREAETVQSVSDVTVSATGTESERLQAELESLPEVLPEGGLVGTIWDTPAGQAAIDAAVESAAKELGRTLSAAESTGTK